MQTKLAQMNRTQRDCLFDPSLSDWTLYRIKRTILHYNSDVLGIFSSGKKYGQRGSVCTSTTLYGTVQSLRVTLGKRSEGEKRESIKNNQE